MKRLYGADQRILPIINHGTRTRTDFVVVHDMEAEDIDAVENYFRRGATADHVGAHLGIPVGGLTGKPKVRQWADLDALVYHAVGGNHAGIGIELAGYAATPRTGWIKRRGQRIALAETLARLCHAYKLGEPKHLKNVLTHGDVTRRFKVAGGHTDPGPGFPMDAVIKLARKRYQKWYG